MSKRPVVIWFYEEDIALLDAKAKQEGSCRSKMARELILDGLSDEGSVVLQGDPLLDKLREVHGS